MSLMLKISFPVIPSEAVEIEIASLIATEEVTVRSNAVV